MVVGELHRGANWQIAQRLASVLGLSGFLWFRASFPVLAATQLVAMILFSILVSVDIRNHAPILLPSLRYGSWKQVITILKPSGYFALGGISTFLWWQGPVLLIEKLLGPVAVAVFALTRTVFNMSRQAMVAMTYAISQDITRLVGERNWTQLRRLYDLSEKVVLLMVPAATIGTLLLCPSLFALWLHKPALYVPSICFLMAITSAVMGIKEHKTQFQTSSNQHQQLIRFTVASYCVMLAASLPMLKFFGVAGLQSVWLVTEIVQLMYILRLNLKLFPEEIHVSVTPMLRLAVVLVLGFGLAAWPVYHNSGWSTLEIWGAAALITLVLTVICYFFFGLKDVWSVVAARLRHRPVVVE
jgi:O-antigen/teichoic acid export membrane protein